MKSMKTRSKPSFYFNVKMFGETRRALIMTRGQVAPKQIGTVHCLVIDRVCIYGWIWYLIHLVKRKMYISYVASHFGMNMTWFLFFTSSGTFLGIPNTCEHKYFGYVRVLVQLKNSVLSADVHLRIRHNNFPILFIVTYMLYLRNLCVA